MERKSNYFTLHDTNSKHISYYDDITWVMNITIKPSTIIIMNAIILMIMLIQLIEAC